MCGIIACIGSDDVVGKLLTGLENLEYRGYDSAGIAVQNGHGLSVEKNAGQISELKQSMARDLPGSTVGIGHTRWSTHGPPTDENAHPHTSSTGRVAVVHNGVIENYQALREELAAEGVEFKSDTDTEVIPHLYERNVDRGMGYEEAFRATIEELDGSYAIALLVEGEDAVFGTRQDSPLVLGVKDDEYYLASDVPAFLEFTDEVAFLEDGDVVRIDPDGVELTDREGDVVEREIEAVEWDPEETGKGQYDHYMLKEIDNQPTSLRQTIDGRIAGEDPTVELEEFPPGSFGEVDEVQFVACGTSYHAAMVGKRLVNEAGVRAQAIRANEYDGSIPITGDTIVVAVSQSGETADTMGALREASRRGARTIALTNVVGSSAAREADDALYIRAGPEIGVAATKTFSSQIVTLALLTDRLAEDVEGAEPRDDRAEFLRAIERLPDDFENLLDRTDAEAVSRKHLDSTAYFFIGTGLEHPVALEGALKFKEITYEHAEGFASGELKHGPLALVTPDTTVFALFTGGNDEKTRTNAIEARTRGAKIVAVAPEGTDVSDVTDDCIRVPQTHPDLSGLLANAQLQLVSYHTANLLQRAIDKPRNLAKSVTVK